MENRIPGAYRWMAFKNKAVTKLKVVLFSLGSNQKHIAGVNAVSGAQESNLEEPD